MCFYLFFCQCLNSPTLCVHIHIHIHMCACVRDQKWTNAISNPSRTFWVWHSFILPCILIGEYSCLKVDLLFKREFSYYLIQIYIPCCMLVIVSWVSFWLDQGAVPARVSLGKCPTADCVWKSRFSKANSRLLVTHICTYVYICSLLVHLSEFNRLYTYICSRCNHFTNYGHTNIGH